MKRIALSLSLSLMMLAAPVSAETSAYFCTDTGTLLCYVRRYAADGSVKWRHRMTIESVTDSGNGDVCVDYTSDFRKAGGRQMYGGPVSLKVVVDESGTVGLDMSSSLVSIFHNLFPRLKATGRGGLTYLPSDMKAGDVLPDIVSSVKAVGIECTVTVTDRHVIGPDTLTVKAGTFPCVVVSEHKVEKATGYSRVTTARTWYCRGVGMVRHDTYDRNMKLETIEELEEIEIP